MTKFNSKIKEFCGKSVDVIGMGVSNLPFIKLLCENNAKVTVLDKNVNLDKSLLSGFDVNYVLGDDYLEHLKSEIIIRTPGLNRFNKKLVMAENNGSIITSEMELFFEVCPTKIIAITGSEGKTTTSTLITKMLEDANYKVHLGGNIGKPLLCDVPFMNENDISVVELSSFQLMSMKQSPNIAVITNLTPNHLDMHSSMDEYRVAKENIFKYQTENDVLITNFDDEITAKYISKGKTLGFSDEKGDAFYKNGEVYINDEPFLEISDIRIVGKHNVSNYMAAILATLGLVSRENVINVAKTFAGVEHRIEFVRELDGVKYYNDSIGTSPTRTIAGLNAFDQKVILIAGGYDKKIPFEPLAPVISEKVKTLILVGDTSDKIEKAVREFDGELDIIKCDDFLCAVNTSRKVSKEGDVVLLSPSCAAFDLFKNFAERGKKFKEIVNNFN